MDFSVLMSVYSKENSGFLSDCLQSLVEQELCANEVVLVEDGPIPGSLLSVIEEYRNKLNIVTVKLSHNCGLAVALNEGLTHCQHAIVARMDSDDITFPERFRKQIDAFKKESSLDILGGFAQEFNVDGVRDLVRVMPITHDEIVTNLFSCPMIHPTVMFKKHPILQLGGYNPGLNRRQDYDLWFRCAKAGLKFKNIAEPLIFYRFSDETNKRQTKKILLQQGLIGFRGVRKLHQPLWKGLAAFYPLIRSYFPIFFEYYISNFIKKFDPRQRISS